MKTRSQLPSGYTFFASGAIAAAVALTACGPDDGVATNATAAPATVAVAPAVAVPPATAPVVAAPAAPVATTPVPVVTAAAPAAAVPAPVAVAPAPVATAPAVVAAPQSVPGAYAPVPAAQPRAARVQTAQAEPAPRARHVASSTLGRIRSVEPIRTRPEGTGVGGVVGGVLGAVVGNQFGHGGGRAAATALGAVGGAVAGNNVERNHRAGITGYRVVVEFDNGDSRTYEEPADDDFRVGDRVTLRGGQLHRV